METLNNLETPSILIPLLVWVVLSIIVAFVGMEKRIGFVLAFLSSMVFSPIIGIIVTMLSRDNEDVKRDEEVLTELRKLNSK